MLTNFERPEESKDLYFKLNSSMQIIESEHSKTYKFSGLYAIYKNEVCYYVGQSKNLASRLSQHIFGKYDSCDKIVCFSPWLRGIDFYEQDKPTQKEILDQNEMTLIKILKPIENLITPNDDFLEDDQITFESLKHGFYDGFLSEMASFCVTLDKYYISLVTGCGDSYCNFEGKAFESHNSYVVNAYKEFGDEAFSMGII